MSKMNEGTYIRRIDELGRVVIPKDIRRSLRIREGDAMSFFINSASQVVMKKYSPIDNITTTAGKYVTVLSKSTASPIVICNLDTVIASSGIPGLKCGRERISSALEGIINSRQVYTRSRCSDCIEPLEGLNYTALFIYPIISGGDIAGAIVLISSDKVSMPSETAIKLIQSAAEFLGSLLED